MARRQISDRHRLSPGSLRLGPGTCKCLSGNQQDTCQTDHVCVVWHKSQCEMPLKTTEIPSRSSQTTATGSLVTWVAVPAPEKRSLIAFPLIRSIKLVPAFIRDRGFFPLALCSELACLHHQQGTWANPSFDHISSSGGNKDSK